jgi:hypothetical protein
MTAMPDGSRYAPCRLGAHHTGLVLKIDGVIKRSSPDML